MDAKDRLFELSDRMFAEQRDFAKKVEVSPSIVSQWRNGVSKSYERRLPQIAAALDTTVEYLLTGSEPAPIPASRPELGEYERRLLAAAAGLSEEEMPLFLSRVERLAEKIKESRI